MTGAVTVRGARWAQATVLRGFPGVESRLRVDDARPLYLAGGAPATRPVARGAHTAVCRLPAPAR